MMTFIVLYGIWTGPNRYTFLFFFFNYYEKLFYLFFVYSRDIWGLAVELNPYLQILPEV